MSMLTALLLAHSHTVEALAGGQYRQWCVGLELSHRDTTPTLPPSLLLFIMPHKNVASIYQRLLTNVFFFSYTVYDFQPNSCYSHNCVLRILTEFEPNIYLFPYWGTKVCTHSCVIPCPCCSFLYKGKSFSSLLWPCCLHWEEGEALCWFCIYSSTFQLV